MNNEMVVSKHNGKLCIKKGNNIVTCDYMDKSGQIIHDNTPMWILKKVDIREAQSVKPLPLYWGQ